MNLDLVYNELTPTKQGYEFNSRCQCEDIFKGGYVNSYASDL